ncbi:acyl-CoA ligase (AMP-forming), exosortase A system-associated [Thauera sp.]|uniref:acyl-CoA ligase (AMP-forming), exosortase A system-associated n=1 Tax=Thauera sp. TaxID=1905334 RepID=UPI002C5D595E|nr:acyl-CoA ligase (AMP-forming), exosortase A system-associated [Thauera sp.]HRP24611.1 acyl-CoA ligase (AMP-forming), exosortase A system-associated [Thauera sp.]
MHSSHLLHHLVSATAAQDAARIALVSGGSPMSYGALQAGVDAFAAGLVALGLARGERVGLYLDKRPEFVVAAFGCSAAGGVFVPVNPILKAEQVDHIVHDCSVRVLVTTPERLATLAATLAGCHDLRHVVLVGRCTERPRLDGASVHLWDEVLQAPARAGHRVIDADMAAILYTSGSTGRPKGVVLSHRNMVAGARSVASYLSNHAGDTLLAALPLSFDAGLSQLTTAFHAGARVVLLNYLLPRDVLKAVERERVTGLTAVPPLWIQLAQLEWPATVTEHLRYIANTGGRMPLDTLGRLRSQLPRTRPFLMYGLTEAFRATYLAPEEIDRRPDSIGKAIPDAEVLVLREDGSECAPNEPGELVQRGALVAMGYWNDAERTAERFRPLPAHAPGREAGLVLPEIAVFSGDTVRRDEEGFLYFIGRRDEMIKTSGYRVSPTEVEEILYATGLVGECVAFGLPHPALGQSIAVIATPLPGATLDTAALLAECRARMPAYMVPTRIEVRDGPLPRNPNGKLDRKALAAE